MEKLNKVTISEAVLREQCLTKDMEDLKAIYGLTSITLTKVLKQLGLSCQESKPVPVLPPGTLTPLEEERPSVTSRIEMVNNAIRRNYHVQAVDPVATRPADIGRGTIARLEEPVIMYHGTNDWVVEGLETQEPRMTFTLDGRQYYCTQREWDEAWFWGRDLERYLIQHSSRNEYTWFEAPMQIQRTPATPNPEGNRAQRRGNPVGQSREYTPSWQSYAHSNRNAGYRVEVDSSQVGSGLLEQMQNTAPPEYTHLTQEGLDQVINSLIESNPSPTVTSEEENRISSESISQDRIQGIVDECIQQTPLQRVRTWVSYNFGINQ